VGLLMVQRPLQSIVLNELKEIVISCKQYQLPVERRKKRTKVKQRQKVKREKKHTIKVVLAQ
jgi:hypothetical protein